MSMKRRMNMDIDMRRRMLMEKRQILLVVDDEPQICRMMERRLGGGGYFDEIITETDPHNVYEILKHRCVTHVLSDFNLNSTADGVHFVTEWRREFPNIERAVIFTSSDLDALRVSPEVSAVVSKDENIDALIAALQGSVTG